MRPSPVSIARRLALSLVFLSFFFCAWSPAQGSLPILYPSITVEGFTFHPPEQWLRKRWSNAEARALFAVSHTDDPFPTDVLLFVPDKKFSDMESQWKTSFPDWSEPGHFQVRKAKAGRTDFTYYSLRGTYHPLAAGKTDRPAHEYFCAVIPAGNRPLYVRLFGPEKDVEEARALFMQTVENALKLKADAGEQIRYESRAWQFKDGLPHNTVRALAQGPDGYLWIGTQKGLARFDGLKFSPWDEAGCPELKKATIRALLCCRDSIWIGTENDGLFRWENGKCARVPLGPANETSILALGEGADGAIWISSRKGLFCYRNGEMVENEATRSLSAATTRAICAGKDGACWFGTSRGLFSWHGTNLAGYSTGTAFIQTLALDREERVWIGSDLGALRFQDGAFYRYDRENGLENLGCSAIFQDRYATLWIGTYGGLYRCSKDSVTKELTSTGMPYDLIHCLLEDTEGNLWVGAKDGLFRLSPQPFKLITTKDGLSHNNVMSVLEDNQGTVWIATWSGGLNRLASNTVDKIVLTKGKARFEKILSLGQGHDKSLWVGGDFSGGLFRLERGKQTGLTNRGLPAFGSVRMISPTPDGALWIGTADGLSRYADGQTTTFTARDGLPGNVIRVVYQAGNQMFVGTDQGLAVKLAGETNAFSRFDPRLTNAVHALYADGHSLWIGTRGAGLFRWQDDRLQNYSMRQGLFDEDVFEILEDDQQRLWMSCLNGVYYVRKEQFTELDHHSVNALTPTVFDTYENNVSIQGNGVAKPGAWKGRDGTLYFATTKGVLTVDPKAEIKKNAVPPPVVIEEIVFDRQMQSLPSKVRSRGPRPAQTDLNLAPEAMNLPPGRGELEFHYTALSYAAPEKSRFRYKLEGVDADWVEAKTRRTAFYNNVPPGRYTFHVMACNNDGVWNSRGAAIGLTLQPHFWQTWWCQSLVVMAGLSLAGWGARYATKKRLQLQLERLEQQHAVEKERSRIAQDLHDELGARLTEIQLLSDHAKKTENRREQIEDNDTIADRAREIARGMDAIVWAVNPQNDSFDTLSAYIGNYAVRMLSKSSVRCRLIIPEEPPSGGISSEVRHNLFLVVKEALNNVVKHAQASEVRLTFHVDESLLLISIEDDGKGFPSPPAPSFGNGLVNMQRRVEHIGGRFEIYAEPGKGTRLRLKVPLELKPTVKHRRV